MQYLVQQRTAFRCEAPKERCFLEILRVVGE